MPIYEYQCDGCQTVFEVFQKVSEPAPSAHSCGSDKVHRILSNTSFVLKGTGWYATDYADKSKKTSDQDSGADKSHKKAETKRATGQTGGAEGIGHGHANATGSADGASKSATDAPKSAKATPADKGSAPR